MGTAIAAGNLALGAYNTFKGGNKPPALSNVPIGSQVPGGQNFYVPSSGATYFVPDTTQASFGQDLSRNALINRLTGLSEADITGQNNARAQELRGEIAGVNAEVAGGVTLNKIRQARQRQRQRELAALEGFHLPDQFGDISPIGQMSAEGGVGGAFAQEAQSAADEALARRGVLNSSIDFDTRGRIATQAAALNEQQKFALLQALQSGAQANVANQMASAQLGLGAAGQNAAQGFARHQFGVQQQAADDAALMNLLSGAGNTAMQLFGQNQQQNNFDRLLETFARGRQLRPGEQGPVNTGSR